MAGGADDAFDMGSAAAAPAPASQAPASAADQPFDLSAAPSSAAASAPATSGAGDSYYAGLTSDYAARAKADDAARRAAITAAQPTPKAPAHQDPGVVANFWAPIKQAGEKLASDAGRITQAKSPDQLPSTGAVLGDVGSLIMSPVTGAFNAAIVQPGADALDKLPAPQATHTEWRGGIPHTYADGPMTPEQQHAANEDAINKALLAAGPKGVKGAGGWDFSRAALADANDARTITAANANAAQYAGKVAQVVHAVPPEVALDAHGELTPEGVEQAGRAGLHPEDLKTGYQAASETQATQTRTAQAAQAEADAQAAAEHAGQQTPGTQEAADAHQTAADKRAAADQAAAAAQGPQAQIAPELQGMAAPEAAAAPEVAPPPEFPDASKWTAPDENAPTTAAGRVAEAASEGVDLSQGQGTQDFATQAKENDLRGTSGAANSWFANQQKQIGAALDRFRQAFGDTDLSAADRGQMVKDAISQLRDSGKAGVTALYQNARDVAQSLGSAGSNLLNLDTQPLLEAMRRLMIDETVPKAVRDALRQQAAQYGLIGGEPRVFEDGTAAVRLRDASGDEGPSVTLLKPPEPLTILNAEDLRQSVNALYTADTSKKTQALKGVIDNAMQAAVERAASEGTGDVGQAFKDARAAHVKQQQTFKAADIVQNLIDWKKGTEIRDASGKVVGGTPTVLPEDAIKKALGSGKDAETNLKRIKLVLLSKPTEASKAAWQAIRSQAIGQIFDQAVVTNANLGGGQVGAVSGAKLNTAISKFGVGKLKVLLDEGEFNQLMKLRRIIETATVPISGTTNPSGSGHLLARFMKNFGGHVWNFASHEIPVVGYPMRVLGGVAEAATQKAAERDTLRGITGFDAKAAAAADAGRRS